MNSLEYDNMVILFLFRTAVISRSNGNDSRRDPVHFNNYTFCWIGKVRLNFRNIQIWFGIENSSGRSSTTEGSWSVVDNPAGSSDEGTNHCKCYGQHIKHARKGFWMDVEMICGPIWSESLHLVFLHNCLYSKVQLPQSIRCDITEFEK